MQPAGRIEPQPWMTVPATRAVIAALTVEGAVARFVGGAVRDALLGRPVENIDAATPDQPETVIRLLEAAGIRAVPTGLEHGTVTAVAEHRAIEITTLRRDVETDGRHATVAFTGDWEADAARRDFTMNALYCDPDGTLYDPQGGRADLAAGRVRFIGDGAARIDEDALRILRYFRFYAHYGVAPPDAAALAACRAKAAAVTGLSGERLGAELLKLLAAPAPAEALGLMIEAGVMGRVLPAVTSADALDELCAAESLDERDVADPLRRLALLLRRGGGDAREAARRLRLSNHQRDRLAALVEPPAEVVAGLDTQAQRRALYRVGAAPFADLVTLAWAEAAFRERRGAEAVAAPYRAMRATAEAWDGPRFPLTGGDVTALGIEPGPEVGRLLAAAEDWWIAGDFQAERRAALAKLTELGGGV